MGEVLQRIIGNLADKQGVEHDLADSHLQQCVAVGIGAGHRFQSDHAAATGLVLDDKRLSQFFLHLRLHRAQDDFVGAAGARGNDEADRFHRVGLRHCGRAEDRADKNECNTGNPHRLFPCVCAICEGAGMRSGFYCVICERACRPVRDIRTRRA